MLCVQQHDIVDDGAGEEMHEDLPHIMVQTMDEVRLCMYA